MIKKKPVKKGNAETEEPPCCGGNPEKLPFLTKWLFGLAIVSVLMIGIPAMLWAQTGHRPGERMSVDAASLELVQQKMNELQEAVKLLMASGQPLDYVSVEAMYPDEGRADCLNGCRTKQVECMGSWTGSVAEGELHPCLAQANACITSCNEAPRLPITCQDRCAVALAGCVQRVVAPQGTVVEDEASSLQQCMGQNQQCLVKACMLESADVLPETYCMDQCKRMKSICRTGSAMYDTNAMQICDMMDVSCTERVCGHEAPTPPQQIRLMNSDQFGEYLVDEQGMALYYFIKDRKEISSCKESCTQTWPVFFREALNLDPALDPMAFGIFQRTDGQLQISYHGWPLYTFINDAKSGDTLGQGINSVWFLMKKDRMMNISDCDQACDHLFEDCKRSEEAPYACQEQQAACRTECQSMSFSGSEMY